MWSGTPPTAATAASSKTAPAWPPGANQRPFLLQTYRRDMGGGVKVVMKEVDAPITVAGRHWGGLRLAWKF